MAEEDQVVTVDQDLGVAEGARNLGYAHMSVESALGKTLYDYDSTMGRDLTLIMHLKLWLKVFKRLLRPSSLLWVSQNFNPPAPQRVKTKVLQRYAFLEGNWIETGTYLGDTTRFLAKTFPSARVTSLEPDFTLFSFNKSRLRKFQNIKLVNSASENSLDDLVSNETSTINLWLDGHFSGDITFRGQTLSPILEELQIIERNIPRLKVCVFVDDIRDFSGDEQTGYPSKNKLVEWANRNNCEWHIEMDIFIAKSRVW